MSPSKSARRRLPLIPEPRDGKLASPTPPAGCGKASLRIPTDRCRSATSTYEPQPARQQCLPTMQRP